MKAFFLREGRVGDEAAGSSSMVFAVNFFKSLFKRQISHVPILTHSPLEILPKNAF